MTDLASLIETVHGMFDEASLVYGHGTDNAWDEAVALTLQVSGFADDENELERTVPDDVRAQVLALAKRRVDERLPLAYLTGRCQFAGLEFLVEPGVVVPRSPIAGLLLEALRPWMKRPPLRVLDLCSGSGCLGILAAYVFEEAEVVLAELNPQAAALAEKNVALHGLTGRVSVCQGDLFERVGGRFDLILSNPPYVDGPDMASLPDEYRAEPELGLAAGADGLDVVRRILRDCGDYLNQNGLLVCEVGASAPALLRAYPALPFVWPHLPAGGDGVFLLEAGALGSHTARLR